MKSIALSQTGGSVFVAAYRVSRVVSCLAPFAAALGILAVCGPAPAAERPNILLITADNLGYGDLPCFNPESLVKAPHLDRLAADGARLTDFYTPSPTCTVSRACLLTGRVPERHGLTIQLPGIAGNYGRGLSPAEVLIPQVLGPAGYATGCFGKWNIGFAPGSRPTERGFDEFFGHASGNIDYYTHIYSGKHDLFRGTEEAHVEGYSTDVFADAAIDFIRRHADRTWFVYLPFNAPHFPNPKNTAEGQPCIWQAPDEAFRAYGYAPETADEKERYRAVVTALDSAIGRVLDALDDFELAGNTFVFFYSDNGAFMLPGRGLEVASNAPLRDGGVTCWEGGIRVAALARWPGRIPAGRVVREPLWSPDLLVACARLAEAKLSDDRVLDGKDPLPVLTEGAKSPHRSLHFAFRTHSALRMGDWKIVRTRPDEPWKLFHLVRDIGEQTDLASRHPQRVAVLAEEFARWERAARAESPIDVGNVGRDRNDLVFVCDFESGDWYRQWGARQPEPTTETVAADPERKFEPLSGKALRVRVEQGGHYGANLQYRFKQQTGSEPDEIYFRYDLRLADDWDPHRGGKFPGLAGTYGRAGWGGRRVNGRDGWSARGLFGGREDSKTPVGFYAYHVDMRGRYGSNWWWDRQDRGRLEDNRWYSIEQYARLNTPGRNDGILRAWVDGELAFEKTDVRMRDVETLKIETVWLNVYLGGSWTSRMDQHLYIDNVVVARKPIGPLRK